MTCSDKCKYAKGDLCRCDCDGANHGILVEEEPKEVQKTMDIYIMEDAPEIAESAKAEEECLKLNDKELYDIEYKMENDYV